MALVQDYLALLQDREIDEQVIDDIMALDRVTYEFSETPPVRERLRQLATAVLRPVARSDILQSHIPLYSAFTVDAFRAWLLKHFQPSKLRVMLSGFSDWERVGLRADNTWSIAPGYGTRYAVHRWYDPTMQFTASSALEQGLRLPQRNPFVPKSFSIVSAKATVRLTSAYVLLCG